MGEKRDRNTAWALTWLAYATYYTGRKGFSVAKKSLRDDLGVSVAALGVIDSVYLAAYAAGQFASGYLGDRIGARRLVGYGMLLSSACCLAFGASNAAGLFALFFCINGLAQSTGWPGTTRAMAEWTVPRTRGTVMAFWATCYQVGGIAATALAGALLVRFGWRWAFFGPAIWIATVAVAVLWLLKRGPSGRVPKGADAQIAMGDAELPRSAPEAETRGEIPEPAQADDGQATPSARGESAFAPPKADGPPREPVAGAADTNTTEAVAAREDAAEHAARARAQRAILSSPVLWFYGTAYFCIKFIRYALLFWLPFYLSEKQGYAEDTAAYVSTAFEVGGIVGVIVIGVASDRLRRFSRALLASTWLVALALALVLYAAVVGQDTTLNVVSLALVGATLFGPDSLISGAAAQDAGGPRAAAMATGFVNGMGSVGAVLEGLAVPWLSQTYGWQSVFNLFVGLAVFAAIALVPTFKRAPAPRA